RQGDRGQDFRTIPNAPSPAYDANLDALIRDVKSRQNLVRSLLEDEDIATIPFVGSANLREDPSELAERIATALTFELSTYQACRSAADAFSYARACIESAGIFVLLVGNLGSSHTNISTDVF